LLKTMPYTVVTLSTGSTTTSSPVQLNWRGGKPTAIQVTANSSFACDFTVQYSNDDVMLIGGTSAATWSGLSSAIGQPATHFLSSTAFPDGVTYTFTGPVAAVRLGSTGIAAAGAGAVLTMHVMQGETI
jgi:hypothetical protein